MTTATQKRTSERLPLADHKHDYLKQSKLNIDDRLRTSRVPWRGQFSPELIEYLITSLCPDSHSFFDPFCGSGTVLYEAVAKGHRAVGFEVNPAAWHLASLSAFAALSMSEKREIIVGLRSLSAAHSQTKPDLFVAPPSPAQLLHRIENHDCHPFLAQALAGVILLGMGDGCDLTQKAIARGFNAVLAILQEQIGRTASAACYLADARCSPLETESIDAIITSPPYINVFNYHQNYRPAAELLGWRPLEAAKSEIGANRKHRQNRFLTVIQYCLDMAQCISSLSQALKSGAPIIIVI